MNDNKVTDNLAYKLLAESKIFKKVPRGTNAVDIEPRSPFSCPLFCFPACWPDKFATDPYSACSLGFQNYVTSWVR